MLWLASSYRVQRVYPLLQVICVDNFFTGSKENIKHLLGKPNFETLRHDVVEKLLLEVGPDLPPCLPGFTCALQVSGLSCLHLILCGPNLAPTAAGLALLQPCLLGASCSSTMWLCRYNPIKTIKTSFLGTMNMLGLAKRTKVRILVAAGCCDSAVSCHQDADSVDCKGTVLLRRSLAHQLLQMLEHFVAKLNSAALAPTPSLPAVQARFLLTSTSEVYGDPLQHPQTEEYWGNVNCIGERSCYDEGKRAAECLTFDYYREHNLDVRALLCISGRLPGTRHAGQV